ncbi:MAG: hypothetical protein ACKPAD_05315, partial [Bacteroidota bacterium]
MAGIHDPSSQVAAGLKLQAVASVQPFGSKQEPLSHSTVASKLQANGLVHPPKMQDPSLHVASGLKLQAVLSVQPATPLPPQSPQASSV